MRRWVALLRLVSAIALVVAVAAFFYPPLRIVLGPKLSPVAQSLGVGALFQERAAAGFMLQISSRPSGAAVSIDGAHRGTTPALLNVVCNEGEEVALAVVAEGYPEYRRSVPCRVGQRAEARIDLSRPR